MKLTRPIERKRLRTQEALNVESDKPSPFDLEWGITPEERSLLRRYIENNEHNGTGVIWTFCVLFPDQATALKTTDHFYPTSSSDSENLADELILLKILRPDEFKQYDPKQGTFREDLRVALNEQLEKGWVGGKWNHWSFVAIKFKTLFPDDSSLLPSTEQLADIRKEIAWDDQTTPSLAFIQLQLERLALQADHSQECYAANQASELRWVCTWAAKLNQRWQRHLLST